MKKYNEEDHRILATWALDCAERVLSLFEAVVPDDSRPRHAIEVGRGWVSTGDFSMQLIRTASLDAHAAAKEVKHSDAASQAAHAAGQAVATAHVPQHAYGAAYYALRAVAGCEATDRLTKVQDELDWQSHGLPAHLRDEIMSHLRVHAESDSVKVTLTKGPDF